MADAVVHLSSVAGSPLLDLEGTRLGRVQDVIARLDQGARLPLVSGLKARIGGRELFVSANRIEHLEPAAARTSTTKLNLAHFERRPGEVLLREDVLDHSLINVTTARLVVARDVVLTCEGGVWRVAGIDPSLAARWRRLLPRRLRGERPPSAQFVEWSELEPFVGHVPTSRLRLARGRLSRLHPAQIADLVEAASHDEGEEIMEAVAQDKELEADIYEELDEEHQLEFLRARSDAEVAGVLSRMESDDAADLLMELDQERRLPVLELLPASKRLKVKRLLGYNPQTAGGLMNPDFLSAPERSTVEQAIELVRRSDIDVERLPTIAVVDGDGRLVGPLSVVTLLKAARHEAIGALIDGGEPAVSADTDLPEIARLMTDYNLMTLPVVDGEGKPIGLLVVDDVLELMLPADWRRRFGLARE
ncbi:MAG TPA: CBS domain-containing protein [Solirubrobacteraceae bacterium]|jgi:CBS domain-containing protein|nr:CBS domain-containing protein [Solirubrobacteraceae bacterium]